MNIDQVVAGVSPSHRLVLRAALCERPAAEVAWRQWRSLVAFDDIDHGAERLMPLIARRGDVIPVDDPVRRRVAGLYRRAWVNNHRMWQEAVPVISALDEAGIAAMVLKGGALLHWYGNDWGVRPMYDVDVAVPVASLEGGHSVVERLRHHSGRGGAQLAQLARNSTGGAGIGRGALGLVARRMEIDLVSN